MAFQRSSVLAVFAFAMLSAVISSSAESPAVAGESLPDATAHGSVTAYRSRHFQLHTDLPSKEAEALLARLEGTLRIISKYWRRSLKGRVTCFVVDNLSNWSDDDLPYPQAKTLLRHVRGGTRIVPSSKGKQAHVYATKHPGIAEHELVHAYCQLAFGACGPDWYKEGMAEMASHYYRKDRSVSCPPEVVEFLRNDGPRTIGQVVGAGEFTGPISLIFAQITEGQNRGEEVMKLWLAADDKTVRQARESYHRSWLLCHFLCNNANYRERFRLLGISYLSHGDVGFDNMFHPVQDQLAFEYHHFLENFDNGYRVDLCHWDWKKEFSVIDDGETKKVSINAARGYQPTGLYVSAGQAYAYAASGRWHSGGERPETNADGDASGRGCLTAAILRDFSLSEPFDLSTTGTFVAGRGGRLYLRCGDKWNELADNKGRIAVRLTKETGGQTAAE